MEFTRREQIFLAVIVVILIGSSGILFWKKDQPAAVTPLPPVLPAAATKENAKPKEVMVYISGAVRQPGVVKLNAEARVIDALNMLGGPLPTADLNAVNLAALLIDGQQIHVPNQGEAGSIAVAYANHGGQSIGGKVNINTADISALDSLPGIGPAMAQKIIDHRKNNGPFRTPEDIKNVSGIGESKYQTIKDKITL